MNLKYEHPMNGCWVSTNITVYSFYNSDLPTGWKNKIDIYGIDFWWRWREEIINQPIGIKLVK